MKSRYDYYEQLFTCTQEQLLKCYKAFLNEIQCGLDAHATDPTAYSPEVSSLRMLDTCLEYPINEKAKGVFYSLQFGGTTLKAQRCMLNGNNTVTLESALKNIRGVYTSPDLPKGLLDKNCTASMLFDELASTVSEVVKQEKSSKKSSGLCFTFSFPLDQKTLNSACLINWTKDFETGIKTNDPVVGQDICALLDKALARKKLNLKTTAVVNDTASCLITGLLTKPKELPPCLVGIIVGTGINGAYVQKDAKFYKYKGVIINTELGNFNKELPRNEIDYEIDSLSLNKGRYLYEKMASNLYIPEISRLLILRIFQRKAPELAWIPLSLSNNGCSAIFHDHSKVAEIMQMEWSWQDLSEEDTQMISQIIDLVFKRSAAMVAVAIATMCKATGCLQPAMGGITVSISGALYTENTEYQQLIQRYLSLICDKATLSLIHLITEKNAGEGAAILAAKISNADGCLL